MAPKSDKTDWGDEHNVLTVTVLGCWGSRQEENLPCAFRPFSPRAHVTPRTVVLGYARSPMTDESLRDKIRPALKGPKDKVETFLASCFFQQGEYGSDDPEENAESDPPVFGALGDRVAALEDSRGGGFRVTGHRIFYLALPPSVYPPVCANIKRACMSPTGWTLHRRREAIRQGFAIVRGAQRGESQSSSPSRSSTGSTTTSAKSSRRTSWS